MRITVRVKPGGSRTQVGGAYGDGQLVVRTTAPAVDGRANAAVIAAVAEAFGLAPARVSIIQGHTARSKVLDLDIDDELGAATLARFLTG